MPVKRTKAPKKNAATVGSRAQVAHGNAKKTSGGLTYKDLKYNKYGRIVSKKASKAAKKNAKRNLGTCLQPRRSGKWGPNC